jgi:multidrug efflux pump subunit AcrA (membrane-fusion protein)
MARVRVSEEQAQAQYNRDLVDRATTLARQREEALAKEAQVRSELIARRDQLRTQLAEVERALAMLGESPGESAFNSVEVNTRGDVPALIRAILATNSHGVTSVQIAKIAEEQGRPFQPVELHSTLSRMVRTGELIATGKPRERVYRLAAQKDSGTEGTTKGE